jgi:hypothetical protein
MKTVLIYDIEYAEHDKRKKLPTELIADLDSYKCQVGYGNLNYRTHQAVHEATGVYAKHCKIELLDGCKQA